MSVVGFGEACPLVYAMELDTYAMMESDEQEERACLFSKIKQCVVAFYHIDETEPYLERPVDDDNCSLSSSSGSSVSDARSSSDLGSDLGEYSDLNKYSSWGLGSSRFSYIESFMFEWVKSFAEGKKLKEVSIDSLKKIKLFISIVCEKTRLLYDIDLLINDLCRFSLPGGPKNKCIKRFGESKKLYQTLLKMNLDDNEMRAMNIILDIGKPSQERYKLHVEKLSLELLQGIKKILVFAVNRCCFQCMQGVPFKSESFSEQLIFKK